MAKRCAEMDVRPSMGTVGDAYDNAMAESFFATLECELIDRRVWKTHTEARHAIFTWIEAWYNPKRRHSSIGQISPIEFERRHHLRTKDAKNINDTNRANLAMADEHGLPTGCCAPVHNPPHVPRKGTSRYEQASPVDKPAPRRATPSNYSESTIANLMENTSEVKNL